MYIITKSLDWLRFQLDLFSIDPTDVKGQAVKSKIDESLVGYNDESSEQHDGS